MNKICYFEIYFFIFYFLTRNKPSHLNRVSSQNLKIPTGAIMGSGMLVVCSNDVL
jgi:hypothetical protein